MTTDRDDRWPDIERVLDEVLDLEEPERSLALDQLCGDDLDLRRLVEKYLHAGEQDHPLDHSLASRLGGLASTFGEARIPVAFASHGRIGAFEIDRLLGEGGMGVVFLAHRVDGQYSQQVALKVLSRGSFDEAARQRFLRERQILANLRHANIAHLLDGGVTEEGIPYLVLEYIDGEPVTDYCRSRDLSRAQRLRLFLQACSGVHYAHRHGVVHRDLKPSNILVEALADGSEAVSVLDFGIARIASQDDLTVTGQMIGTPGYASPEQLGGQHADVDRQSDVFSLGVILYELVCDCRPFAGSNPSEVLLSVLEGKLVSPRKRLPSLPADLDTIVTKCLETEPHRRYGSVQALIDDLERFLSGRPISARPVGIPERVVLRARRHPITAGIVVASVVAVLASLTALVVGTLRYTRQLERERASAVTAHENAEDLLKFMLEDLRLGLEPLGRLDLLDQVARKALSYYEGQPLSEMQGEALHRHGQAVYNLGLVLDVQGQHTEAQQAFRRFVRIGEQLYAEDADPFWKLEVAWGLHSIAYSLAECGDTAQALASARQALELCRSLSPALADEALYPPRLFEILSNASWLERDAGNLSLAKELIVEALDLATATDGTPADDPQWRRRREIALSSLGLVQQQDGQLEDAIASFDQALTLIQELVADDPQNIQFLNEMQLVHSRLGTALLDMDQPATARPHLERTLSIAQKLAELEPANARWQRELNVAYATLACCQRELGELEGALHNLEQAQALSSAIAVAEPESPSAQNDLAWDLLELGRVEHLLGRKRRAEQLFADAVEIMRATTAAYPQPYYQDTLFQALLELGHKEEATELARELARQGWQSPDFIELCRTHGIEPPAE